MLDFTSFGQSVSGDLALCCGSCDHPRHILLPLDKLKALSQPVSLIFSCLANSRLFLQRASLTFSYLANSRLNLQPVSLTSSHFANSKLFSQPASLSPPSSGQIWHHCKPSLQLWRTSMNTSVSKPLLMRRSQACLALLLQLRDISGRDA